MTKKSSVIILSLAIILIFSLTSCETGGDDGGQGADFDETQYYTKTEVDALIADAITQAVDDATPDSYTIAPVAADGPGKAIQSDGDWGGAGVAGPWTVPSGANFGVFKIEIGSTTTASPTYVYIGANNTDQCEDYLLLDDNMVIDVTLPSYSAASIYAWTDDPACTTTTNEYVVTCLYWIK